MIKHFTVLAFFGLLEYQVLFHESYGSAASNAWLEYSGVTAAGLIVLSLVQLLRGSREFKEEENTGKTKGEKNVRKGKIVGMTAYIGALVIGSIVTESFGGQFIVFLVTTIVGMVGISVYDSIKKKKNRTSKIPFLRKRKKIESTRISAFTIPILYLYVVNFLIAAQLGRNLAFQFILILSCFILYDNLSREESFVKKFKNKVDDFELQHYIFHRWSKYFDFFLGTWYFISLHLNGIINIHVMLALIFLYMCIFFTVLLRITHRFSIKDFTGIVLMAGALTAIPGLIYIFTDLEVPAFVVAVFIFFGFDMGDLYWHRKHFTKKHKATSIFWFQKLAIYILVVLFIWELHQIGTNNLMSIDNVYTSIFNTSEEGITPKISEPLIQSTVDVVDIENAVHVRGE